MFQAVKIKAYLKYGEPFLDILQDEALKLPDCLILGSRPANASNFVESEKLLKLFVSPNIIAQAIILIPGTDNNFVSNLSTVSAILVTISLICLSYNSINSINWIKCNEIEVSLIPTVVLARLLSSMDFSFLKCPFEEAYKRLEISSSFRAAISSAEGYFLRRE